MKRITAADVARLAGVSKATVSYVVNNKTNSRIPKETSDKVLNVILETGYVPNQTARFLKTGISKTIFLRVTNLGLFHTKFALELQNLVLDNKYHIQLMTDIPKSYLLEKSINIEEQNFCGVIALDDYFRDKYYKSKISIPYIGCGRYVSKEFDYIEINNMDLTKMSYEYLVDLGCKKILFLSHSWIYSYYTKEKFNDLFNYLDEKGIESIKVNFNDVFIERISCHLFMNNYIKENGFDYDGVICFSDEIALGLYQSLKLNNINVPDDVKIISADGIDDILYMNYPITTIDVRSDLLVNLSWEFLQNRLKNNDIPKQIKHINRDEMKIIENWR